MKEDIDDVCRHPRQLKRGPTFAPFCGMCSQQWQESNSCASPLVNLRTHNDGGSHTQNYGQHFELQQNGSSKIELVRLLQKRNKCRLFFGCCCYRAFFSDEEAMLEVAKSTQDATKKTAPAKNVWFILCTGIAVVLGSDNYQSSRSLFLKVANPAKDPNTTASPLPLVGGSTFAPTAIHCGGIQSCGVSVCIHMCIYVRLLNSIRNNFF